MFLMTDTQIIKGFERGDEGITQHYFYGYCMDAYRICDAMYQLRNKEGLDFMSLTHNYYIRLMTTQWQQLKDRRRDIPLRKWMIRGFRFVVQDQLKKYNAEHGRLDYVSDVSRFEPTEHYSRSEINQMLEEICQTYYAGDRQSQELLRMMLIYGYKGKEVGAQWGMTPSAVSQRMKKMMDEVVRPYFMANYVDHKISEASVMAMPMETQACYDAIVEPNPISQMEQKDPRRITPDFITQLQPGEVFVFGSNLQGFHAGGAAHIAVTHFGAVWGQGVGMQGQCYAIPTMQGPASTIRPYVDEFIAYAREHKDQRFLVTRIGCGIAGFVPEDIAPLFSEARDLDNVALPADFWAVL